MDDIKILKGNIIYTKTKDEFEICEHGYLVCKDGKSRRNLSDTSIPTWRGTN